ncbi:MAG: hypothetical protein WCP21_19510, partial [Armatimonadota bacterium]
MTPRAMAVVSVLLSLAARGPACAAPEACLSTINLPGLAWDIALTPDGERAICASPDKTLTVWDLATGTCLKTLNGHTDAVKTVAVTPDGQWAVSGSWDNTLKVWDLATGECLRTLTGHTGKVGAVAVTPDGM